MAKRMIIMLAAMLVVVGGIFGYKFYTAMQAGKASAAQVQPPVTVSAELVSEDTWQPALRTTGSLDAFQGVMISNEFAGVVETIGFESGDVVKKGTLLVQLNVATDQAQLRSYEVAAELARLNLERATSLRVSNVNAQADLDEAQAQRDQALANVENARSVISKKSIAAPFDGKIGIRLVNIGQFLQPGTPIVSLQSLDPIYVNFALPQQNVSKAQKSQAVEVTLDAYPGIVFKGSITAFDSRLDDATRTVRVQATLVNKEGLLQPGMFGSVAVLLPQKDKVITVPQSAVTYNPYGNVIYVIEKAAAPAGQSAGAAQQLLTVRQQFVKLGETRGDQISVITGLKAGDQVVTSGQLKLRDGVNVRIDNKVPAVNDPKPTPPNA
jgi:membrane fusion protein, multidrug efflux system